MSKALQTELVSCSYNCGISVMNTVSFCLSFFHRFFPPFTPPSLIIIMDHDGGEKRERYICI